MIELIKIIDGEPKPYSFAAFRADNKHTVYGVTISNRHLNAQDVYRVRTLPAPEQVGHRAVPNAVPDLIGTEWVLGWTLEPLGADAARAERNEMLGSSDWMAVTDRTMTELEIAYRQGLRDVPQQAGFPNTVTWPNKPEGI
tara:strand:- start:286 stop:708 length:423 start_codon:yes stop_codon:yes gene_type:complete